MLELQELWLNLFALTGMAYRGGGKSLVLPRVFQKVEDELHRL